MKSHHAERIYALDLLRSFAILAVIAYHFPHSESTMVFRALTHYGHWGVDLFFILSGYLIGGQWFRSLEKGRTSLKSFYSRRFFRTLPSYYALVAVVFIANFGFGGPLPDWRYLFFLQTFGAMTVLAHTWSLCVEEHFYLLFPIFGKAVWKNRARAPYYFAALLLVPLLLRAGAWLWLRPDIDVATNIDSAWIKLLNYIFYPTYMRIDALAVGVGVAYLEIFKPALWARAMLHSNRLLAGSVATLLVAAAVSWHRFSFLGASLSFSLVAAGCGALLASALAPRSLLSRFRLPGAKTIALTSYSLYLTHGYSMGAVEWAIQNRGLSAHSLLTIAMNVVSISVGAALLYFGVEKPFLKWRDRRQAKAAHSNELEAIDHSRKVG